MFLVDYIKYKNEQQLHQEQQQIILKQLQNKNTTITNYDDDDAQKHKLESNKSNNLKRFDLKFSK